MSMHPAPAQRGAMEVIFAPKTPTRHTVTVRRADGTVETVELDTKDFLRHDLAHLVVESVLGIDDGVWGSVAAGASLNGDGLDRAGVARAERIAGPMQTLMRVAAGPDAILAVLAEIAPDDATAHVADRLHEGFRAVAGHWNATRHGGEMHLTWPLPAPNHPSS